MRLSALLQGLPVRRLEGDPDVLALTADSRQVRPGALYVAMPSARTDTHRFLPDVAAAGGVAALVRDAAGFSLAREQGLAAVLLDADARPVDLQYSTGPRGELIPPAPRLEWARALGELGARFYRDPMAALRVFAVTGTNGKTTVAWMLRAALEALGRPASYIGTLGFQVRGQLRELDNTTPFPVELWSMAAEARDAGCTDLVIEASSHALWERRLSGFRVHGAAFTNLSQDHLDYHGTMETYAEAKELLFGEFAPECMAFNVDDPCGASWAGKYTGVRTIGFGFGPLAELRCLECETHVDRLRLRLGYRGQTCEVRAPVGGRFNAANALAATALLVAAGTPLDAACCAMGLVQPAPGRFEPVPNDLGIGVLVDFAHTEDALDKLLRSARELKPRRLIVVFGCGGDRDRTKRPKMARVAGRLADHVVITSDNPRTEDPVRILDDVAGGLPESADSVRIVDRREAVAHAIRTAQPGDLVVIAGKGHENYQVVEHMKFPMDDRELAREALEARSR